MPSLAGTNHQFQLPVLWVQGPSSTYFLLIAPPPTPTPTDDSSPPSTGEYGLPSFLTMTANTYPPLLNGHARKYSAPVLPPFMVSAPGKVILYGEHAVVYGKAAIAAAISLRSYLLVTFLSKTRRTVSLRFPDIGLDHTWNIDDLPWEIFQGPEKKKTYYDSVTELDDELVEAIQPFIDEVATDSSISDHMRRIHQTSAMAFLYLFLSLSFPSQHACIYTLRSTIPVGAGLGSSASVAVCLAAALLHQVHALSGPHRDQPPEEASLQVARINAWAFVGELATQRNPSGVDNTVASGGKAVFFRRRDYGRPPEARPLPRFPELPLLLVNSNQPRTTAAELAKVAALKEKFPSAANSMLDAIDAVTMESLKLLEDESQSTNDPVVLKKLGELAAVNHGLLVSLGVSHAKLERIRGMIDASGLGWTKLTGAGGGGCAITVLNPDKVGETSVGPTTKPTSSALENLTDELTEAGFAPFTTTLAGDGVGVLYPAVLHNASGEHGGEDIDQDKFLRAKGIEGIEKLVGVVSSANNGQRNGHTSEGWRFWRV